MITAVRGFKMLAAAVILTLGFTGCGGDDGGSGDGVDLHDRGYKGSYDSVTYEGQTYKTVKIGTQKWFAENLNYDAPFSECYDNDSRFCDAYGRLYPLGVAVTACPAGWHLPSDAEWAQLTNFAGGSSTAGKKLKATSGWRDYNGMIGSGSDTYGFSAKPGGGRVISFERAGCYGDWWSATGGEKSMSCTGESVQSIGMPPTPPNTQYYMFSVRCVED